MTDLKTTRKQLYVVEGTPALSIDSDAYVRCGLSEKMDDNDKLILAVYLHLKDEGWRQRQLKKINKIFEGKTTPTSRMVTVYDLISS